MPLDHYVSQVHLRQFYSPELNSRQMHAIKKKDLKYFPADSKSVCRIESGSTNEYLTESRAIEEFLKTIEPQYPEAVRALEAGQPQHQSIYTIAGFVAFIVSCSPAAMRLHSSVAKESLEESARILDKHGKFPKPPSELGGESLAEVRRWIGGIGC